MINYAILGYGRMGQKHAKAIGRAQNAAISGLIDIDKVKLTGSDLPKFQSLEDFLVVDKETDVVIISTPNGLHLEQAKKCLNAGKNVLIEKPMALHKGDVNSLVVEARLKNKKIFSGWQVQYSPAIVFLLDKISDGSLGKVLSVQADCFWSRGSEYYSDGWHGSKALDGGPLYTQFSHIIHLLFKMFNRMKFQQASFSKLRPEIQTEFEDTGNILFTAQDTPLRLNYSTASPHGSQINSLTVITERAILKLEGAYFNQISINANLDIKLNDLVYEDVAQYCLSKQLCFISDTMANDGFYFDPLTLDVISCIDEIYSLRPSF